MAAKRQLKKPTTPKVNKDAKPAGAKPRTVSDEVYRCPRCGHKYAKQDGNFNVSKSPLFAGNNGYVVYCKKCVSEMFDENVALFDKDEDTAMERVCQIIDLCVDDTAWAAARKISANRSRMSGYISKLNLDQSSKDATYTDTIIRRSEAAVENAATLQDVEQNEDNKNFMEAVRRFGLGFNEGDYDTLQSEYNSWVERCGVPIDKRQDELYVSICYLKLNLQNSVRTNSTGVGTLANSYKAFIEAATTEIEERKRKAEADMQLSPLGEMIRDIEEYCPADFYKDKTLYADFDHLKEYISRFMARPLRNLLTGSKEMDKEFNLSETEE